MKVRKIGVVGAGTMGSGIAALAASAGVPVELLDMPSTEGKDRSAIARGGITRALKARPAAFMDDARAALVRPGNTEDDLERLADCDLVIEAIIEKPEPKQALYARLEKILKPHAVIATNTSGIPVTLLAEGRSPAFQRQFLGMHFFNPPRYLHLLEIIPTEYTSPETLATARRVGERVFGKGIVVAKDVPGFIANRLGIFGLVAALRLMEEFDLTIDEVDALTGPAIGRPKSATFRTGDITGIDVLGYVASGLSQATGEDFSLPEWVQRLVESGRAGEKTGAGFYKKEGKVIQTLDWRTLEYGEQQKPESEALAMLNKAKSLQARLELIPTLPGAHGDFLRKYFLQLAHYVLVTSPKVAYDPLGVDHAMEWGYAWEAGPFQLIDGIGHDFHRDGFAKLGMDMPALLAKAHGAFYRPTPAGGGWEMMGWDGEFRPVAAADAAEGEARITAQSLRDSKAVIEQWKDANLLDMGDGVALFEFRSKMNTLGEGVLTALHAALARVEQDGLQGLVIGNDDPRTFTAGADLMAVGGLAQKGEWETLDHAIATFQGTSMALKAAPFPVVIAPFGLTLGGGAEFSLHADLVQANAELYMGLVEVGVGLIPGGGGTKELLFRFTEALQPYEEADLFEGVKRAFKLIAMATTSTSALDARKLGFLRDRDRVSMNRDLQLADAKMRVVDLAPDYVAPAPRTIKALGRDGLGNLRYALFSFQEAGQASAHDVVIGGKVAHILCGGDGPPRMVTEQDILDLEREAFLSLLGTPETQARIAHMLSTGKPLRN
ncbi:MAG: 3-hydroxyacyl-CoA dehydrogenase/enoyl-CoA hydratase family protein [Gemmatimonadaceae bacterium]|nr:3-hydroxyacyl-CoA dehydrogenase/enoyl-CoA hydratase family protein [Gemmatimonadaceae bacterium]